MMYKFKENVLDEILPMADEPRATEWLEEEVNYLALRHGGLDAIPVASIYVMARLYVDGPSDESALAKDLKMEEADVSEYLEFLCERKFAQKDSSGFTYSLTIPGEDACRAVGRNIVIRKRNWMKGRVQHLDSLHSDLDKF